MEDINIIEILESVSLEEIPYKLYNVALDCDCYYHGIKYFNRRNHLCITLFEENGDKVFYNEKGQFYSPVSSTYGDKCLLFPSKENRDWSKVRFMPSKDTPCIVSDLINFNPAIDPFYIRDYTEDLKTEWKHIIPVDKYNFYTKTFNPIFDYGQNKI